MDILDKITAEMAPILPPTAKPSSSSSSSTNRSNVWNRGSTKPSTTPSRPGTTEAKLEKSGPSPASLPTTFSLPRIPKRTSDGNSKSESSEPSIKKRPLGTGSQLSVKDSFKPFTTENVQLNMWNLDISKMDEVVNKILFQVSMLVGEETIDINMRLSSVGGDVNRQYRRRAQWELFQTWFKHNTALFRGNADSSVAAYDCAETIYVSSSNYVGGFEEHVTKFTSKDFEERDWYIVTKLSRRKDPQFVIRVKAIGEVYTNGRRALAVENRSELTRCIETVTNQVLHNGDFLLYSSGIFPVNDTAHTIKPDSVTEIKTGFNKQTRVIENNDGTLRAILTLDMTNSVFFRPQSLLNFLSTKYEERKCSGRPYNSHSNNSHRNGDRHHHRGNRNEIDYNVEDVKKMEHEMKNEEITNAGLTALSHALKGLECEATHLKKTQANRSILAFSVSDKTANLHTFEWNQTDTKEISVASFFREKYNLELKFPDLPLIISKRKTKTDLYPAETLRIMPGQRLLTKNLTPDIQSFMTGKNSMLPIKHIQHAQRIISHYLKLDNVKRPNKHLESFKIKFPTNAAIVVQAKILAPPVIKFASNVSFIPNPKQGVKFKSNGKFFKPARVANVAVMNFDNRFSDTKRFCEQLVRHGREQGMVFERHPQDWKLFETSPHDVTGVKNFMTECAKAKISIIIGICAEKRPEMHDVMKYYEEKMGQVTMQMTAITAGKVIDGSRETTDNIIRKLNAKCGGINFTIEVPRAISGVQICSDFDRMRRKLYEKTQFIGFDLSHAGSRSTYDIEMGTFDGHPTVVGVSYSLKNVADLGGFAYYQDSREHRLMYLQDKFSICTENYWKKCQELPETIVIYRTGTGEGDYLKIREEVEEMKESCKLKRPGRQPKIIMLSALKSSHTRVFPEHIRGARASEQNIGTGTCIDNMGPSVSGFEEFIICSQAPMIGTSRPTKFVIITNEANWSMNEIVNVTYELAFAHQVSYQPTSLPSVLFAAGNLSKRGNNNFKTFQHLDQINECSISIARNHAEITEDIQKEMASMIIEKFDKSINSNTVSARNYWA